MCLALFTGSRFNHVWINRTLCKEGYAIELTCFFSEDFDEFTTDDFTFFLWINFASQCRKETIFSISADHADPHVVCKHLHYLVAFVQTKQTVVYKYASQLIANCLVQKCRYNR